MKPFEPWLEAQDRPSIVIVDDSAANLKVYTKLASTIGQNVDVHSFCQPSAALEWLKNHGADLVISDFKMPGMNGSEFTRQIRLLQTCLDLPVVIVTAYADHNFRVEALEAGATDFLRNPVDQMEFRTRARNLLRLGRHQRLMRAQAIALERELLESERSRAQILRESRAWLAQIIDTVPALISATDAQGNCIFVNAYEGPSRDSLKKLPLQELDKQVLESGKALEPIEETLSDAAGNVRNFLTVKSPLRDSEGNTVAVLTTSVDITERKEAEAKLTYQAEHDYLTSLPNRAHLYGRLKQELAKPADQQFLALHFIDLDRFKYVNDGLGHHHGDRLLQEVGFRLRSAVRDCDIVARLGGDEFAILQTGVEKPGDAGQFANRINELLVKPFLIDGREITTSASIGVTLCPHDGDTPEQLLQNADLAMYRVKAGRGNGFGFFEDDMLSTAREAARLREALKIALSEEEFILHYQPQIALESGALVGAEALIRWQTEEGLICPGKFLPAADEAGLMREIDVWVIQECCRQAKEWLERFGRSVRIWVNISPASFVANAAADIIQRALQSTGLPPDLLGVELTEDMLPQDNDSAIQELDKLHRMGIGVSIDDFGTGYSSLSKLANLHVDKLKIDRAFVAGLERAEDAAIIRAVVSLGQALRIEVLAEGVENSGQLEQLRLAGCESVQGYYTGRPVDAQGFESFLRRPHLNAEMRGQPKVSPFAPVAVQP